MNVHFSSLGTVFWLHLDRVQLQRPEVFSYGSKEYRYFLLKDGLRYSRVFCWRFISENSRSKKTLRATSGKLKPRSDRKLLRWNRKFTSFRIQLKLSKNSKNRISYLVRPGLAPFFFFYCTCELNFSACYNKFNLR